MPYTLRVSTVRFVALFALLISQILCLAQQATNPVGIGEARIAIVPIIGTGTFEDPKRPMLDTEGISFVWTPSDDGFSAIVLITSADASKANNAMKRAGANAKVFERGKETLDKVEKEIKSIKKNFKWEILLGTASQEVSK